MNKFRFAGRAAAAACILCLLLAACGMSTEEQWQEQYDLGQQYLLNGDYEQAIVAFTAAIEIDPNVVGAYLYRAEAYIEGEVTSASEENLQLALADYSTALELEDALADIYVYRGDVYAALGSDDDLTAAIQDYTSALSLDDTLEDVYVSRIYVSRGDAYASLGTEEDLSAAVSDYESAIALDGRRQELYLEIAAIHIRTENYPAAIEAYTSAIDCGLDDAEVWIGRAEAYLAADTEGETVGEDGDVILSAYQEAAIEDYWQAYWSGADGSEIFPAILQVYSDAGDTSGVINALVSVISRDPENPEWYLLRAEAYLDMAQKESEDVLSGDSDEESGESLSYSLQSSYMQKALEAYLTAIELGAEDADVYLAAAEIYVWLNDDDGAIALLESFSGSDERLTSLKEELAAAKDELMETIRKSWLEDLVDLAVSFEEEVLAYQVHSAEDIYPDELLALLEDQEDALLFELENGYYLGIYHYGDGLYYGEMEDGERSGYGVWIIQTDAIKGDETMKRLCGYVGEWADDVPNGWGNWQVYSETDYVYTYGYEINFVDGVMDGAGTYYRRDSFPSSFNEYEIEIEDAVVTWAENGCPVEVGSEVTSFKTYATRY